MLPNKKGTGKSQQTIALDIYANPAGIKQAEKAAWDISEAIAKKIFNWADYLQDTQPNVETVGDWSIAFEKDYFVRRARTGKSETTYRTEYQSGFNALPKDALLTSDLLRRLIEGSPADTRSRQRFCSFAKQLAKFAGIELGFNPSDFAGDYSPAEVSPRTLPTDEEISDWHDRIPHDGWRLVFGLMATYGLRNHEVFNLDLASLQKSPGILTVLDGKTGGRRVWACYPEWWDSWRLWDIERLPQVTGKDNSALGGRVTQALKRYGFVKPYNLRHAWAVRTMEFGLDVSLAAAQMGHSVAVHTNVYHHWIDDRVHQRAFEALMNRSDRPMPPLKF
jgi:integrase